VKLRSQWVYADESSWQEVGGDKAGMRAGIGGLDSEDIGRTVGRYSRLLG
jgi:hypothetical protein